MEIGRSPIKLVRNQVRCSLCDARLAGRAAGATTVAEYHGPILYAVTITDGRKELHACTLARPVADAG